MDPRESSCEVHFTYTVLSARGSEEPVRDSIFLLRQTMCDYLCRAQPEKIFNVFR